MNKYFILSFLLTGFLFAQPSPTSGEQILEAIYQKQKLTNSSRVKNINFKNIGPSVMSGRVVDISVNPDDPTEFYAAFATGGLWHTKDNGISFNSIFDNSVTQNIGEIEVHWPSRTIWVGTGENNSSRSSYSGVGILKSIDNGNSWQHKGLSDSHHIGKILVNPDDPNHLIVGVTGHLYSENDMRGVYVSTDGGENWENTLFINNRTGIIDMDHSPKDFNVIYASSWEKDRKAWNFDGDGHSSGIYKSIDAGKSWELLTNEKRGFPVGEGVGRIGVSVFDNNVVYVIHDNQFRREKKENSSGKENISKDYFKSISIKDFLSLDNKKLNKFLKDNSFQKEYTAKSIKNLVRQGKAKPADLAIYLEDSNSLLFDTPVIGAEVYKSIDGGLSWLKTHDGYLDNLYYSYGYYFGHIYVAPYDVDKIYIYGVPILTSNDGGKTFTSIGKSNVHVDHHALWINPSRPGHLINGNDGGINITYNDGENWMKNNSIPVGQFYAINVDNDRPYNVYGGLQDNGVWKARYNSLDNERWHSTGHNPWTGIMGGDGMNIEIDNRDSNIVYTGFQFGNYSRLDLKNNKRKSIKPRHEIGESPYRFNWQTPILLSTHNQDILYYGGNRLHRSLNQGDNWETISPDLTNGGKKGNVPYGTLTTISESPLKFGLLYTGSDDGLIQVSRGGGVKWKNISNNLPKDLWVSRVVASAFQEGRVYATLNGYRWDDFSPYVYVSEDYGETWKSIKSNLPDSPLNVIIEDSVKENILYVGNDNGVYISFDMGQNWEPFSKGLTNAAVHDLVIQKEERHLLVGTHGRSIYLADISKIQEADQNLLDKSFHFFPVKEIKYSENWGKKWSAWGKPNKPEAKFYFFNKSEKSYALTIKNNQGITLSKTSGELEKGFSSIIYGLTIDKNGREIYDRKNKTKRLQKSDDGLYYLSPGTYEVVLKVPSGSYKQELIIK
ncbi:MAG: glycosyl hydrolase [Bacteroidota bacterium]|nr:glycosyl hydrolase [Bacteroidota bacterium]